MSIENLDVRILQADWGSFRDQIMAVRTEVFIREQRVPAGIEQDNRDAGSRFVLAVDRDGQALGTARLLPTGQIGRMAVLKPHRNQGLGSAMLQELLNIAATAGMQSVWLHAQTHALQFYSRHGFLAEGPVFEEAGIPHRKMSRFFNHE